MDIKNKSESLKLILEEQRRNSSYLLHIYNRMRAGESVLLAASFAIVAYLYSAPAGSGTIPIAQRFFIPTEDYGKVIYFIAVAFLAFGIFKLVINVFGNNPWETPYQSSKDNYNYKPLDTLMYFKKRHDKTGAINVKQYSTRKKELNFLFYCILISAIILIVIKTLS